MGFEPTILAGGQPQAYSLDSSATRTGMQPYQLGQIKGNETQGACSFRVSNGGDFERLDFEIMEKYWGFKLRYEA